MAKRAARVCRRKVYLSQNAAFTAARKLWAKLQLVAYKCPQCSEWHLARHKRERMESLFARIQETAAQEAAINA